VREREKERERERERETHCAAGRAPGETPISSRKDYKVNREVCFAGDANIQGKYSTLLLPRFEKVSTADDRPRLFISMRLRSIVAFRVLFFLGEQKEAGIFFSCRSAFLEVTVAYPRKFFYEHARVRARRVCPTSSYGRRSRGSS